MEQDAALVHGDFVGGKIMWLPHKSTILFEYRPNLPDDLFNHPVVITSEELTNTVSVLMMTTFDGVGIETRFAPDSIEILVYAPVHPAPQHPNSAGIGGPLQLVFNGNEKTFNKATWVNMRTEYRIPYLCLDLWQSWKGNKNETLTLDIESYESLMRYRQEFVLRHWVPLLDQKEKEKKEEIRRQEAANKERREKDWRPKQSKSLDRMLRDHPIRPRSFDQQSRPTTLMEKTTWWNPEYQPSQRSVAQTAEWNVQGSSRAASRSCDDPPKSKSMSSVMIPGPESHTHKVDAEWDQEPEATQWEPPRASNRQPLQELGTESTKNTSRNYASVAHTRFSYAAAPELPASTIPATTPLRKWLVLAPKSRAPRES
ncbi:hypothetical protein SMACR_08222 [Sordaria macrospora]|uniref:WGS project CABT00000000 data, contig 2.43 n=2 Tax=Sordaria macrospora TaxID=5147 RepID=F7W873_SORMK|nr:uncharacterized protein SMAC_08222 [Sordaria macrospora k-hell]KAA8628339.1 hypothetical protein SMACR_08222 [Sordaria macrospora]WPJ61090.1 hypothetical protein SMAC4_08222 [Sordaria macrospora]CCC13718.1 unnamed protein product [Sordaria macrospora k-hell]